MGKRSDFPRRERDLYSTPLHGLQPLLPYLPWGTEFDEPCAGEGKLVDHLTGSGMKCLMASDIEPMASGIDDRDVFDRRVCFGDMFITNPPWPHPGADGEPTLSIALHLSSIAPTWLLLPADFAHNRYYGRISDRCLKIVSVGRVSWMDNGVKGKDNAAWYLFDANNTQPTVFVGRAA